MTHELDEYMDWLDWCYKNDIDPEEEQFYQRADIEHDIGREDEGTIYTLRTS